ncbi:MAG: tetratricopeptide repeat protein [Bacteroidales bacterium]|nr:tetratricopeptide repeat protein [Bacteroidales bacterium]
MKIKISLLMAFLAVNYLFAQNYTEKLLNSFATSYTYEKSGDYSQAIKVMKDVYDEKSYEINLRLGWLTYLTGNYTESASYYNKAMQLQPLSEEARLGYVLPASAMGNWDAVLREYLKILENNPYQTNVLYRVGNIYYARNDFAKAYTYFEKLVNLYPFSYDGLLMYAWTNLKLGKYKEAKILFQKVLMLSPDDASAKEGLALIK